VKQGAVESFDPDVGLGWVVDSSGVRHRFHCTAITDGSRHIEPGRAVGIVIGPAADGTWEATAVMPLG